MVGCHVNVASHRGLHGGLGAMNEIATVVGGHAHVLTYSPPPPPPPGHNADAV